MLSVFHGLPQISHLQVFELEADEWTDAMTVEGAWWGNRTAGWIGSVLGPLLGLMGALVGTLSGLGRGRKFVIGICWSSIVFGVVCLVVGLVAVAVSQPYVVYFPLVLIGVLSTVIMSSILPTIRRKFEDVELRRMEAMDVSAA